MAGSQQMQYQQQQQQQQQQMILQQQLMSGEPSDDFWLALIGLAEYFRQQNPPNIRYCIHCLMCILSSKPPPRIEARTHLQLGSFLLKYTKHYDMATAHLERAVNLCGNLSGFSDCYYEAGSQLAKAYVCQGKAQQAVSCLQDIHRTGQHSSYWHCRIMLQLAQLALDEGNIKAAIYYLQMGEDAASRFGAAYARIVFKLGHGMLLLVQREFGGVDSVLGACSQLINAYNDSARNKEVCKIMFLIMQTCHFLYASQVLTAAQPLKQLQDALQLLMNLPPEPAVAPMVPSSLSNAYDKFNWLNRELLCVIVFAVTAMHELQSGRIDRVRRNVEKGLQHLESLKNTDPKHPLVPRLSLVLHENLVQSCLVSDKRSVAISSIGRMITILPSCSERVSRRFEGRIRLLLGFYYNVMGRIDVAEWHLHSIQTQALEAPDREFGFIVELSRCLLLGKMNRRNEATMVLQRFDEFVAAGKMSPPALVRAAREYCIAIISLGQRKPNEARDALTRAIQYANADGLCRIGLLCRLLIGHIYNVHQNPKDARDQLELASQTAKSTGDAELTVSAGRLLAESCYLGSRLFFQQGAQQQAAVAEQMAQAYTADCGPYTQALMQDTTLARSQPEHNSLMMWPQQNFVGSPPHVNTQPTTSSTNFVQQPQMPSQMSPRIPVQQQQVIQTQQQNFVPQQMAAVQHQMAQHSPQIPVQQAQQQLIQQQQQQQRQIQQQFLLSSPPSAGMQHQAMQQAASSFSPFSPPMYSTGVPIGLSPQQLMQAQMSSAAAASNIYAASMHFQEQQQQQHRH